MLASAPAARAGPAPTASTSGNPISIVLQGVELSETDPEVAAWSPDDRFIVTMALSDSAHVLFRDARTGAIVNRLHLPDPAGTGSLTMESRSITYDDTGHRVLAKAWMIGGVAGQCTWVTYAIDLDTMTITPDYSRRGPHDCDDVPLDERPADEGPSGADVLSGVLARAHHSTLQVRSQTSQGLEDTIGLVITDAQGNAVRSLARPALLSLRHAALASDGRRLAMVVESDDYTTSSVRTTALLFDAATARYLPGGAVLDGHYNQVRWIDDGHYLLSRENLWSDRDLAPTMGDDAQVSTPVPARIIDADTGATVAAPIAPRCYIRPVAAQGWTVVGAGLANCVTIDGKFRGANARTLQRYKPGSGWQDFAVAATAGGYIDALATSPDGASIAVVVQSRESDGLYTVLLIDVATGKVLARTALGRDQPSADLTFARDGQSVILPLDTRRLVWTPHSGAPPVLLVTADILNSGLSQDTVVADRGALIVGGLGMGAMVRFDLASGARLPDLAFGDVIAAGFIPGTPMFWAASASAGVRYWDTRSWSPMLTSYQFGDQHYLNATADGRYDTNLGPDSDEFRWVVNDAPLASLRSQVFMRTYFEPRLAERLRQCIVASGGCARAFPKRPPPTDLNRVLPVVTIDAIRAGPLPDTAQVDVSVAQGVDTSAPNHQTRSGIYNLRLFRNGALVGEYPAAQPDSFAQSLADWQVTNAVQPGTDGRAHASFVVALPTTSADPIAFSAYAFNSDRVKSDTTTARYAPSALVERKPQAYVLAIGLNDYAERRLQLQFSASDARLIHDRLASVPGYDTHPIALVGDGRIIPKAAIVAALDLLAGGDRARDLATLHTAGVDGSAFAPATPDDLVIISFSGHGWADAHSNFYLLAGDSSWPESAEFPVAQSLVSSAELSTMLKRIDAGEMTLVIDACHSAASVDTIGFKPGPMGDPGLGQLAYDKGIRVLAAAQAGDLAWEDPARRQGLLTYALAQEGIDGGPFGKADLNHDARIMLDEWLRYAFIRLPSLSQEAHAPDRRTLGRFTVLKDSQAVPAQPQEPALFDFTSTPSRVVLRSQQP